MPAAFASRRGTLCSLVSVCLSLTVCLSVCLPACLSVWLLRRSEGCGGEGKQTETETQSVCETLFFKKKTGIEWKFPADLAAPEETECTHVYSLVLDSGHAVEVCGCGWVCG